MGIRCRWQACGRGGRVERSGDKGVANTLYVHANGRAHTQEKKPWASSMLPKTVPETKGSARPFHGSLVRAASNSAPTAL